MADRRELTSRDVRHDLVYPLREASTYGVPSPFLHLLLHNLFPIKIILKIKIKPDHDDKSAAENFLHEIQCKVVTQLMCLS